MSCVAHRGRARTLAPKKHRRHAEPGETFVGEVKAGQYIGEMAYFTREPASASVRARTTMILLEWDIAEVRHLANHHSHSNPSQAEAFSMLPSLFCRDMATRLAAAQNEKVGHKGVCLHKLMKTFVFEKLKCFQERRLIPGILCCDVNQSGLPFALSR